MISRKEHVELNDNQQITKVTIIKQNCSRCGRPCNTVLTDGKRMVCPFCIIDKVMGI